MIIAGLVFIQIEIGNICIDPFATHFSIRSKGDNLVLSFELTFLAGTQILVGVGPGIFRKFWKISTDLPLLWDHPDRRFFHQALQSLFSRGIDTVVELVEL